MLKTKAELYFLLIIVYLQSVNWYLEEPPAESLGQIITFVFFHHDPECLHVCKAQILQKTCTAG